MSHPTDLPAIYRRAADHIARVGLMKNGFVLPLGTGQPYRPLDARPVCTVGAIRWAITGNPEADSAEARAAVAFASSRLPSEAPETDGTPDPLEHVAAWSDRPERDAAEVVVRLRGWALDAERVALTGLAVAA